MSWRLPFAMIATAGAMLLALAWPFSSNATIDPAPLPDGDRLAAYQRSLDDSWQRVTESYPDAERPPVEFVTEMTRDNFDQTLGGCLRAAGFETSYDGTGFSLTSPVDLEPEQGTVDRFACESAYPWAGTLKRLVSVDERAATYDYFTRFLAPCLVVHGMRMPAPPSRQDFAMQIADGDRWHPYSSESLQGADQAQWESLERDCPSLPPWQREAASG